MSVVQAVRGRAIACVAALGLTAALVLACSAPRNDPLISAAELSTPTPLPSDPLAPPTPTPTAEEAEQPPDIFGFEYIGVVRIAQWDDDGLEMENFIVGYPMVQGYVYDVRMVELDSDGYQSALEKGEVDVVLEMSRAAGGDWYRKVTESGAVLDVGSLFGPDSDIRIGVHAGLKERAPALVELLGKIRPGKELLDGLKARLTKGRTGVGPPVGGMIFFKQNVDEWTGWMTSAAAQGVKDAIDENKTSLHRKCLRVQGSNNFYCK